MEAIIRAVVLSIVQGGATGAMESSSSRLAAATLWAVVTAVLAMAALGCAAAAFWLWQVPNLGPVGASIAVSGGLVAAALMALAATRRALAPTKPPPAPAETLGLLLREGGRLFRENKRAILVAALVAGLAVERYERDK